MSHVGFNADMETDETRIRDPLHVNTVSYQLSYL